MDDDKRFRNTCGNCLYNNFDFSKNEYQDTYINWSGTSTSKGEGKFIIEFTKDGKVNFQKLLGPKTSYGLIGNWNFTGKIGDVKNKEQIILHNTFTPYPRDLIYNIKELRNKKLVIFRKVTFQSGEMDEEEFTFEQ